MTAAAATTGAPVHNSTFSAFIFSILAWTLFLAWSVKVKAGYGAQVLPTVIGIILAGIAVRRYKMHWPGSGLEESTLGQQGQRRRISRPDALPLVLMAMIGYGIAQLVFLGSAFLLLVFAFGASLVPWSRIPLCRNRFFVAGASVFAGAALPLLVTPAHIDPFHFLFAAWALGTSACIALVFRQ